MYTLKENIKLCKKTLEKQGKKFDVGLCYSKLVREKKLSKEEFIKLYKHYAR